MYQILIVIILILTRTYSKCIICRCSIMFNLGYLWKLSRKILTVKKYIIFESSLLSLFKKCPVCHLSVTPSLLINGTLLKIKRKCSNKDIWHSQPTINDYPAGNLLISTGILSAGLLPQKAIRLFEFMNCAAISRRTFFVIKKLSCLLQLILLGITNSLK